MTIQLSTLRLKQPCHTESTDHLIVQSSDLIHSTAYYPAQFLENLFSVLTIYIGDMRVHEAAFFSMLQDLVVAKSQKITCRA